VQPRGHPRQRAQSLKQHAITSGAETLQLRGD
jgi:hypothetical protein